MRKNYAEKSAMQLGISTVSGMYSYCNSDVARPDTDTDNAGI